MKLTLASSWSGNCIRRTVMKEGEENNWQDDHAAPLVRFIHVIVSFGAILL